jgi:hypothetical protein
MTRFFSSGGPLVRLPEYLTRCTLPVRLLDNGKWVKSICGRQLTGAHLARNECPACKRPFRPSPEYNKTQEAKRRRIQRDCGMLPRSQLVR